MRKLRLDPETLRVRSFVISTEQPVGGTVAGFLKATNDDRQTTATGYFTTICPPPEPPTQFPSVGCPIVPPEPVDPNDEYRLTN